jgi:hypothetical protein
MSKNIVIQYVRDANKRPVGCLVGVRRGDTTQFDIGWSLCRKNDKFDRHQAIGLAVCRAGSQDVMPHTIRRALDSFNRNIDEAVQKLVRKAK